MVKSLTLSLQGNVLQIQHYPDVIAVKRIDDPAARQLQAMALHYFDLGYCRHALNALASLDRLTQPLLAEALWISSIARYFKCFGNNKARRQLSFNKVFKSNPEAEPAFSYFKNLRDKHIVHDENPYSQAITGLLLNPESLQFKVADVISLALNVFTADDTHIQSFSYLVQFTFDWVDNKRNELHDRLGKEYEQKTYASLLALPDITYEMPPANKIGETR